MQSKEQSDVEVYTPLAVTWPFSSGVRVQVGGVALLYKPVLIDSHYVQGDARQQIQDHIRCGQIDPAIHLVEQLAPGTLASHPRVAFRLHCQKFIELVCKLCYIPCCRLQLYRLGIKALPHKPVWSLTCLSHPALLGHTLNAAFCLSRATCALTLGCLPFCMSCGSLL